MSVEVHFNNIYHCGITSSSVGNCMIARKSSAYGNKKAFSPTENVRKWKNNEKETLLFENLVVSCTFYCIEFCSQHSVFKEIADSKISLTVCCRFFTVCKIFQIIKHCITFSLTKCLETQIKSSKDSNIAYQNSREFRDLTSVLLLGKTEK